MHLLQRAQMEMAVLLQHLLIKQVCCSVQSNNSCAAHIKGQRATSSTLLSSFNASEHWDRTNARPMPSVLLIPNISSGQYPHSVVYSRDTAETLNSPDKVGKMPA